MLSVSGRIMHYLFIVSVVLVALIVHQPMAGCKSIEGSNSGAPEHNHHKLKHSHNHHQKPSAPNMWTILGQTVKAAASEEPAEVPVDIILPAEHHKHRHRHHSDAGADKHPHQPSAAVGSPNCPKCQANAANIVMTEEELTELRITYVKNQILKKLKLTERPDVSLSGLPLPLPVAKGATMQLNDDDELTGIPDDFYAKTNQKIIFPQLDNAHCEDAMALGSTMCFSMTIPADIESLDIESAQLWVYKQPHITDTDVNFLISEVNTWKSSRVVKPFAIQDTNATESWVKIDIAHRMSTWISQNDLSHVIEISCNTCDPDPTFDLLSLDSDYRPFIVVNTFTDRRVRRQKRSLDCAAGVSECCREKLYISFAEIGWSDWILHPTGYDAYFCRGSCASAATITLSGSHYTSVLRKVMYQRNSSKSNSLELVPCCTATQFSSLTLFYMDTNHTATQKTLPNMVVEACGCM